MEIRDFDDSNSFTIERSTDEDSGDGGLLCNICGTPMYITYGRDGCWSCPGCDAHVDDIDHCPICGGEVSAPNIGHFLCTQCDAQLLPPMFYTGPAFQCAAASSWTLGQALFVGFVTVLGSAFVYNYGLIVDGCNAAYEAILAAMWDALWHILHGNTSSDACYEPDADIQPPQVDFSDPDVRRDAAGFVDDSLNGIFPLCHESYVDFIWLFNWDHVEVYAREHHNEEGELIGYFLALWLGDLYYCPALLQLCVPFINGQDPLFDVDGALTTVSGYHITLAPLLPLLHPVEIGAVVNRCNHRVQRYLWEIRPQPGTPLGEASWRCRLRAIDAFFRPKLFAVLEFPGWSTKYHKYQRLDSLSTRAVTTLWDNRTIIHEYADVEVVHTLNRKNRDRERAHRDRICHICSHFPVVETKGMHPGVLWMEGSGSPAGQGHCNIRHYTELADLLFWLHELLYWDMRVTASLAFDQDIHRLLSPHRWHATQQYGGVWFQRSIFVRSRWHGWNACKDTDTDSDIGDDYEPDVDIPDPVRRDAPPAKGSVAMEIDPSGCSSPGGSDGLGSADSIEVDVDQVLGLYCLGAPLANEDLDSLDPPLDIDDIDPDDL